MKKLYVGNLSYDTTEEALESFFQGYGPIASVKILTDPYSRQSRGFGFVELDDDHKALEAIQTLDGQNLDGKNLKINEARPQTERRGSSRNGHGGGGRGGSGYGNRSSYRGGGRRSSERGGRNY